jgi:methionyl-tRNA synthetase
MSPFIPEGSSRIAAQLGMSLDDGGDVTSREWNDALAGQTLPKASPVFPRIEVEEE